MLPSIRSRLRARGREVWIRWSEFLQDPLTSRNTKRFIAGIRWNASLPNSPISSGPMAVSRHSFLARIGWNSLPRQKPFCPCSGGHIARRIWKGLSLQSKYGGDLPGPLSVALSRESGSTVAGGPTEATQCLLDFRRSLKFRLHFVSDRGPWCTQHHATSLGSSDALGEG